MHMHSLMMDGSSPEFPEFRPLELTIQRAFWHIHTIIAVALVEGVEVN